MCLLRERVCVRCLCISIVISHALFSNILLVIALLFIRRPAALCLRRWRAGVCPIRGGRLLAPTGPSPADARVAAAAAAGSARLSDLAAPRAGLPCPSRGR